MAKYFDQFPLVFYDINRNSVQTPTYQLPVNLLVRVRVLVEKLDRVFHYYTYTVKDGDTPEILAEKYYNEPEAHWLILLTNNITDPQYDWPLNNRNFDNYIVGKYGSLETAQTTWKKWFKCYRVDDTGTGESYIRKFEISEEQYDDPDLQTEATISETINLSGSVLNVYFPYKERISCFDWEFNANEARRNIKLIKPEYYSGIRQEFLSIMNSASGIKKTSTSPNLRDL